MFICRSLRHVRLVDSRKYRSFLLDSPDGPNQLFSSCSPFGLSLTKQDVMITKLTHSKETNHTRKQNHASETIDKK